MNTSFEDQQYQSTLDYLYSFVDYSLTRQDRLAAANFDLRRMFQFMDLLGNPQKKFPVIHVAGTKGKGSTAAMITSVLMEAGYKTGLYTSPHLHDYVERIQVDQKNISHDGLTYLVNQIKPVIEQVPELTTFEITTALGFLFFAEEKVDIAVVEVGLGGRLDATNVVSPLVSVITSLSFDHMNVLGDTIGQIATEKAGIIKQNRPIVLAPQEETPRQVVKRIAEERSAPILIVGHDVLFCQAGHSLDGQSLNIWKKEEQPSFDEYIQSTIQTKWKPVQIEIPLLGFHQIQNAATAYATIEVARKEGIQISEEAIQKGFANVKWPGRFEILSTKPIFIIDSAHNPDSALKLRLAIDDYLCNKSIILVFGASEDKDIYGMFSSLLPRVKTVVATQSTHPRAMAADKLVELAHQYGCPAIATYDIASALKQALKTADADSAIVVAGSIFVAAAASEEWMKIADHKSEKK